jgi:hypothetical protein
MQTRLADYPALVNYNLHIGGKTDMAKTTHVLPHMRNEI